MVLAESVLHPYGIDFDRPPAQEEKKASGEDSGLESSGLDDAGKQAKKTVTRSAAPSEMVGDTLSSVLLAAAAPSLSDGSIGLVAALRPSEALGAVPASERRVRHAGGADTTPGGAVQVGLCTPSSINSPGGGGCGGAAHLQTPHSARPRFRRLGEEAEAAAAQAAAAAAQVSMTPVRVVPAPRFAGPPSEASDPAATPAPEDTAGAGLTVSEGSGCVVTPSLRKLQAMSAEQLRRVEGFSIRIPGEAAVTFLEAVDLSEIRVPLDHVVSIDVVEKTVDFYPDLYFPTPASKPVPGEGLNVKVEIRMANMPDDVTEEVLEVCIFCCSPKYIHHGHITTGDLPECRIPVCELSGSNLHICCPETVPIVGAGCIRVPQGTHVLRSSKKKTQKNTTMKEETSKETKRTKKKKKRNNSARIQ